MYIINNEANYIKIEDVYNKNLNLVQDDSQKEVGSYLELFVNYKLKLAEAKVLRYDKDPVYLKEFKSYKEQLIKSYLTDKKVTESLVREAYERTENEVKAQHILVLLDEVEIDTKTVFNDSPICFLNFIEKIKK